MKNRLMGTLATALLATSMMSVPAMAQNAYANWNKNNDVGIDRNEFNAGFGRYGTFKKWDSNSDGILSENEWRTGIGTHADRWNSRFGTTAWNDWNTDGAVGFSENEFNTGVFGGYDRNRSGYIEEPEYGDVGDDIGDGGLFDV